MSAADRQSEERDASPAERSAASEVEAVDAGLSALFPASPPSDQGWNTAVATATPVRALASATAAILNIRIATFTSATDRTLNYYATASPTSRPSLISRMMSASAAMSA